MTIDRRPWTAGVFVLALAAGCSKDVPPPPTGVDADIRFEEEMRKARKGETPLRPADKP